MKSNLLLLLFLSLLFLFSCKSIFLIEYEQQSKEKYSSEDFLFEIGIGKTIDEAKNNAISNISMRFVAEIESKIQFSEIYYEDGEETSESTLIKINNNIKSEFTAYGINFSDIEEDRNNFFVTAYLEKSKVLSYLYDSLKKNVTKLSQLINILEQGKINNIFYHFKEINDLVSKSDKIILQISILGEDDKFVDYYKEQEQRISKLKRDYKEITYFQIDVYENNERTSYINKIVNDYGFNISNSGISNYSIQGDIQISYRKNNHLIETKWDIVLFLVDSDGNKINTFYNQIESFGLDEVDSYFNGHGECYSSINFWIESFLNI